MAVEIGALLAKQKDELEHGEWQSWVFENCLFSLRTAQIYMRAHKAKTQGLRFSALKSLYGPPDEDETTEVPAGDADRPRKDEPDQGTIDIRAVNDALASLPAFPYSGQQFIEKHSIGVLSDVALTRLEWLADLYQSVAGRSKIGIRLSDDTHFHPSLRFISELHREFPDLDITVELSNCATYHGMNPTKRKTRRGIKRHIRQCLERIAMDGARPWS